MSGTCTLHLAPSLHWSGPAVSFTLHPIASYRIPSYEEERTDTVRTLVNQSTNRSIKRASRVSVFPFLVPLPVFLKSTYSYVLYIYIYFTAPIPIPMPLLYASTVLYSMVSYTASYCTVYVAARTRTREASEATARLLDSKRE